MNKVLKGLLVAGVTLTIGGSGLFATSVTAEAAAITSTQESRINELIKEKQEVIQKKRVSRDKNEQKALGIRLSEIEREISAIYRGEVEVTLPSVELPTTEESTEAVELTVQEQINALIKEKMEVIARKKVSRDNYEQKALGMRLNEIEREISELQRGRGNTNTSTTPEANSDVDAKIQALINEKMEVIAKKKVSRDKNEQKALGKQIDAIEKAIKQLKKNR